MGLLDWTEKNPALTQGLLAAAFGAMAGRGTRLQALGQGGITGLLGYSNAQGRMADAEKEKEAAKMRQVQMGMLESQMTQQQAQAAQRAKDQEAFRSAFSPTSGPQAMAGGGGPTMANAEKIGQVPKFDPRSMLGMGASPEAVMRAQQFNDALTPKRKLRDVSPGAVVIDETSGQEVFRAPEKQDLNSLIVMGPDGKPMLNQVAFDAKRQIAAAGRQITNLNVNTDKALGTTLAEGLGKQIDNSFANAQGAVSSINTAQQLKAAIDSGKIVAGPTSSFRVLGLQVGQMLGVGGKDSAETLANTRMAIQAMAKAELDAAQMMKGQGQITEAERSIIRRAAAGDINDLTGPEMRLLAEAMEKTGRFKIGLHEQNVRALSKQPGVENLMPFYQIQSPPEYAPAAAPGESAGRVRRFNPKTGRIE